MSQFRRVVRVLGLLWTYALAIVLMCLMLVAYATQSRSVVVLLDSFGEAAIEFWGFWVLAPVMSAAVAYWLCRDEESAPSDSGDRTEPIPSDDE